MFNCFLSNKLLTPSQSGFLPGDSIIAQLLSIIHERQTAFDVRGVFLDISKAFGKVWNYGLIFKSKSYGVWFLDIISKIVNKELFLNGQTSGWRKINSGVPKRSVLGPLLFLIYINDLPDGIRSMCKILLLIHLFFEKVLDAFVRKLNTDLEKISSWVYQWKM